MTITFRIWLTALIIQPILFCFVFLWAAIIIVPFEIGGSIPGILILSIVLKMLRRIRISTGIKWGLLFVTALGLATLCSLWIILALNEGWARLSGEDYLFLIPAPIAALLALFIHHKAIHEYLRGEASDTLPLDQEP